MNYIQAAPDHAEELKEQTAADWSTWHLVMSGTQPAKRKFYSP
jgi:hypothetical protein